MSDDLIERLSVDFRMMRTYDDPTGPFVRYQDHAQALTEARAEIETKTQAIADMARQMHEMQSELSTLRARVQEVVGPFAAASASYDPDDGEPEAFGANDAIWGDDGLTVGHLRAARQLMEEVK